MATVSCSLCLENVSDRTSFTYHVCGHVYHTRCVGNWHGNPCPQCRVAWDRQDSRNFSLAAAELGVPVSQLLPPIPAAQPDPEPTMPQAPRDIAVLCCSRVGPPPEFIELGSQVLGYDWEAAEWTCLRCDRCVARVSIVAQLGLDQDPPWCSLHGSPKTLCVAFSDVLQFRHIRRSRLPATVCWACLSPQCLDLDSRCAVMHYHENQPSTPIVVQDSPARNSVPRGSVIRIRSRGARTEAASASSSHTASSSSTGTADTSHGTFSSAGRQLRRVLQIH